MHPRALKVAVCLAASVWLGIVAAVAQRPTPSAMASPTAAPSAAALPTATPKPRAYVRFWNMLIGPTAPSLQLLQSESATLTTAPPGNSFAGYLPVDPATYTFTVRRPNDPNAVIKRLPITLRGDVYITLLASAGRDGKPDVQLIDDTVDPKTDDGLGSIVVRHFFPGANVTVSVGNQPAGSPLAAGENAVFKGLALTPATSLTLQATGLGPQPKTWKLEVDFTMGHHLTMLVIPDPYGRFRPQLVLDGSVSKPVLPPPNKPHTGGT